jgi:2,3-dihydroxy-p-cumate/2,3-dihydroxybenzoate 3,4-dioxygenase
MILYEKLGYVALSVTDIERSTKFYQEILGLQLVGRMEKGPSFFRCSSDHHNIVLYPGKEPGLKRVGFEVKDPEELESAFKYLTEQGLDPQDVEESELKVLKQGRTIRFKDPFAGITFELYSDMTQVAGAYVPTVVDIARLGHLVINVANYDELIKFVTEVLNFRQSDRVQDRVAFFRCYPNPYHHTFALANSNQNGLHHVNFMVTDIDDIGRAMNRLKKNDVPIVYGPGRHEASGSIFLYFLDPDGMTLEYSFGMEEFPTSEARKGRLLDADPKILDIWGGLPDPKFAKTGMIEK